MLLQPAKQALDNITLSVLELVEQPRQTGLRLAFHRAIRNDRLHAIAIAIAPEGFSIVAFVSYELAAPLARSAPAGRHLDTIE